MMKYEYYILFNHHGLQDIIFEKSGHIIIVIKNKYPIRGKAIDYPPPPRNVAGCRCWLFLLSYGVT